MEIHDAAQIMMNCILSRTFLTKGPIHNLTLQIYASFPMCVCVCVCVCVCMCVCVCVCVCVLFLLLLLQAICQIDCGDIVIE